MNIIANRLLRYLVEHLGLDENKLASPGEWAQGLWSLLLTYIPGTHTRKVYHTLTRGRFLFTASGHVHVCCLAWHWEDEQRGALFFYPADNAAELEPAARTYLASIGKNLEDGQSLRCPPDLAARAYWHEGD